MVGHCTDTCCLGTEGILGGWALQGYLVVGHCRDTLRLGTAVRLRTEGKDNIDFETLTTPLRGWGMSTKPSIKRTFSSQAPPPPETIK